MRSTISCNTIIDNKKMCPRCNNLKDCSLFWKNKKSPSGYQTYCIDCFNLTPSIKESRKKYRKSEKAKVSSRKTQLKLFYGITLEQWEEAFKTQNGLCGICKKDLLKLRPKQRHTDHNHITHKFRGLLCSKCNLALGWKEYIDKYSKQFEEYCNKT